MKGLDIDFCSAEFSARVRLMVTMVAAVTVSVAAVGFYRQQQSESIAPAPVAVTAAPVAPSPPQRNTTIQQQVLAAASLPWGRLFAALETAPAHHVVLRSVEPMVDTGTVMIEGEAESVSAMSECLDTFGAMGLGQVTLLHHRPAATPVGPGSGGVEQVQFAARAVWLDRSARAQPALGSDRINDRLLESQLIKPTEVAALMPELLAIAKASALAVHSVDHDRGRDAGKADIVTLSLEAYGDYRAAREFINRAVGLRRGVTLWQLSLRKAVAANGQPASADALAARIVLRIYLGAVA